MTSPITQHALSQHGVSQRWTRRLLGRAADITGAAVIAMLVAAWFLAETATRRSMDERAELIMAAFWVLSFAAVGWSIARRRPDNRIAWLCLAFSLVWAMFYVIDALLALESLRVGTLKRPALWAALAYPLWVPGVSLVGYILLVFPNGRLPSPKWRRPAALLTTVSAALVITGFFLPGEVDESGLINPLGIESFATFKTGAAALFLVVLLVGSLIGSATAPLFRYRRASGIERLQLKWLIAAGAISATGYAVLFIVNYPVQLVWSSIPISIGMAMHRYRLYDFNRIISRTVTYSLVGLIIAVVYSVPVIALPRLLGQSSDMIVAASTLAAAAVFNPVRRWIQRTVDHRFNRTTYNVERELQALAGRLSEQIDLGSLSTDLAGAINRTLLPATTSIWIKAAE